MSLRWKRTKAFFLSITFFLLALFLVFALVFGIKYICDINDDTNMPIYSVDTDEKRIAITFDVAWGSENIDDIVEILEKHNIKATFFLVGSWIDDNKDKVKLINEKGHEIGNHSNTHPNMKEVSDEDIVNEIEITSEKISNITGQRVKLFRPPFGETTDELMDICNSLDYTVVKWDVDSLDWKGISSNQITDRVCKAAKSGSIVLFHASSNNLKDYLDRTITQLEKNGYKIGNVSDLIYKDNYTINSSGVQKLKKN